jgi:site-specific recombinase XerD
MNAIPDIQPSPAWQDAWLGFELDMLARGRSSKTITSRHSTTMILARRMTNQGIDPAGVTKAVMQRYMAAELAGRRHSGALTVYNDLRQFFCWYAEEYGATDPMTDLPRPKGNEAPVQVLTPNQIRAVLGACSGRSWEDVRNRAIVLMLLETGLRRSELLALTPSQPVRRPGQLHAQVRQPRRNRADLPGHRHRVRRQDHGLQRRADRRPCGRIVHPIGSRNSQRPTGHRRGS